MDWELGKREEVMYWWDEYKKAGTSLWEESLRQINKFGAGLGQVWQEGYGNLGGGN